METKQIESIYSYSFYSEESNKGKVAILRKKAERISDFKNKISGIIYKDIEFFKEMSCEDMIKHFNCFVDGLVGQDIQNAIKDVHTSYSNKFEQMIKKSMFKLCEIHPSYYEKNGKLLLNGKHEYRKGDFKRFLKKEYSTP